MNPHVLPQVRWRSLWRPGDILLALTVFALLVALWSLWLPRGEGSRVQIRQGGALYTEIDLAVRKTLRVTGPLGDTVVEVEPGRVRVSADPGPRQYCVRQGWLQRAGDVAVCAPNQVSLHVLGQTTLYDTLAY